MAPRCIVRQCSNAARADRACAYFSLPQDPDIRREWLQFAQPEQRALAVQNPKVCSRHFAAEHFTLRDGPFQRSNLTKNARPTLFGPMALVEPPSTDDKLMRALKARQHVAKARRNALEAIEQFRLLLRAEQLSSTPEPGFLACGQDDASFAAFLQGYNADTLVAAMSRLPVYAADLFQRHPVVGHSVEVVKRASELYGLALFEQQVPRDRSAKLLYDMVAYSCEAARSFALTSLTPLLHTKSTCFQEGTASVRSATQAQGKLTALSRGGVFLRQKVQEMMTTLLTTSSGSLEVCSQAVRSHTH